MFLVFFELKSINQSINQLKLIYATKMMIIDWSDRINRVQWNENVM